MGPLNGQVVLFTVFLCLESGFAYMEALAAHASVGKFEPMVAFICNKPAMHRTVNGWEVDYKQNCTDEPKQILDYCKTVYPDHDIKNAIEVTYKIEIPDWPKFDGPEPEKTGTHKVFPWKCLVEGFESEALLVPQHCIFDHEHDSNMCARPSMWKSRAEKECLSRDMVLESSGMLVLCDLDSFRGVEYVCCPKDDSKTEDSTEDSKTADSEAEEKELDDYLAYLQGYDMEQFSNEHAKFKAAEKAMQKQQHEKVTKMMKKWQDARENVADMRKSDAQGAEQLNKEITERFQRMYKAFEKEGESEKKQLVSLHQQRVQAMFNRKKRVLMTSYKEELESETPSSAKVLSYLKQYIRTEEKDRLHTVNRFEHLRDTDQEEAARVHDSLVRHLKLIDDRITDAVTMLDRNTELRDKIKPEIEQFRHNKFRSLDLTIDDVVMTPKLDSEGETTSEHLPIIDRILDSGDVSSEEHEYTNIKIDDEGLTMQETNQEPAVAHAQSNGASVQGAQASFSEKGSSSASASSVVGLAVGSVSVFIIIVVAVVMLKKRSARQPITHGFVEVDPAASPEERHVANMQMNGYENPTYRYFEVGSGN
ncbi:amyloid-beta precursor-like protein [Mya arenaria]|uniref:amyloid-beta precursor-like protein n=1 Tax=Mya arenaria TaxID=6604 RepID=UPI0022E6562E|nr:amyloid-beta precursor-like protein [Mya arenaria]